MPGRINEAPALTSGWAVFRGNEMKSPIFKTRREAEVYGIAQNHPVPGAVRQVGNRVTGD